MTASPAKKSSVNSSLKQIPFPTSVKEMRELGWERPDVILFTGDAFVDHPSFGAAVIARILNAAGYTVAVVPQPNWRDDLRDFKKFGQPKLFFGVTSGNMDSMVNHYTANKRLRSNDAFTPGNAAGQRPDYAASAYSKILRSLYPDALIVLGGIEASLRRVTHYDYWSDSLQPSILCRSDADIILYGMGDFSVLRLADELRAGTSDEQIHSLPQTVFRTFQRPDDDESSILLSSYEDCVKNKFCFAQNFVLLEKESNQTVQRRFIEQTGDSWIVVNPPYPYEFGKTIDAVYDLPYSRSPHPRYNGKPSIPAYEMIKDSVTIHRGCFGGCSFCTIAAHQGKFIASRSKESILTELRTIADAPKFKGHITDLGGPAANMYRMEGKDQSICHHCKRASCIFPSVCINLNADHTPLIELYKDAGNVPGIRKITIGSGIRYDLLIDRDDKPLTPSALIYLKELFLHYISGRLKVAPEHTSGKVLKLLRKPPFNFFLHIHKRFASLNEQYERKQQLIPYFISSLPESGLEEMAELSEHLRALKLNLEQVQDFTPTPMTLASVMYHTGIDPYSKKNLYIPRTPAEKKIQQMFFFLYKKEKRNELKEELKKIKAFDVIKRLGLSPQ